MYSEKLIIENFKNFLENKQIKQKDIILSEFINSISYFKNQYKKIFEKISEGIIIVDDNFLIKDVLNDHFCTWINLKKEECIGKSVFKFFNKVFDFEENEINDLYLKSNEELIPVSVKIIKENIDNNLFYKLIILNQKEIIQENRRLEKIISLYKTLYLINDLILRASDLKELFDEIVKILVEVGKYKFALIGKIDTNEIIPLAFYGDKDYEEYLTNHTISNHILEKIKKDYLITSDMEKEEYKFSKKVVIPFYIENKYAILKHTFLNKKYVLIVYLKENYKVDEIEVNLLKQILHNLSFASIFAENKNYPEFIKQYDIITMLPNRRGFFEELKEKIELEHIKSIKSALAVVDINAFNKINEAFGFWVGDLVLKQIAEKIKNNVSDKDIVGRIGGDQFAIWFNNISSKEEVINRLNKIFENGELELQIENYEFLVTFSIGVAVYPDDGSDLETLFSKAYLSMKEIKKVGKGVMFYTKNLHKNIEYESLRLELELIEALKNREFFLVYQPVIDLKNKNVFGAEALLRWNSPKRGLVSPAKFIPVLEKKGMIIEVGYCIMDKICEFLNKYPNLEQNISMNISVKQMYLGNFSELLKARMKPCEDSFDKLIIEVTESVLMENVDEIIYEINKLRELGIRFEIDDFGTGYSSLNYFKKLPVYALKIDKSFIDNIPSSKEDSAIVKAIIKMTHTLEKKVVAEGVETKEQLEFLKENNCDYIQGYYFSKPLKEEEYVQFLKNFNFNDF